ncbi:MAG TPA: LuxR C-terminal-related transcriptional regulator, partial [Baekduia sp.]|nr:LuxR C-terminal-related transcriptional regulator [Baekduia sp.]
LLTAGRQEAGRRGIRVFTARGAELEQEFPHGLVRQLLERPLRDLPADERAGVLEGAAAPAGPVVGLAAGASATTVAESAFAVVHGLWWVCANLAQRGPLVLLADDLHWADTASLRFLAYLRRRIEDVPVVVLAAARPVAEGERAELLHQLTAEPGTAVVEPAPLSADAVAGLLGAGAQPAFVAAVHQAAGGNPFLTRTLLSALADAGVRPVAAEAPRVAELAARGVPADVVRRMGAAGPAARALARAVAVLGTRAQLHHAAALAGLADAEAAAAADALAAQGLLRSGPELDFVHPLLRLAAARDVPDAERAVLHGRAARLLAADGAGSERVAVHLVAAVASGDPWVVGELRAAARAMAARGEPAAAAGHLRRALAEPPRAPERAAVLHELGLAELHAGMLDDSEAHLRAAVAVGDEATRAAVRRDLAIALRSRRRYGESAATTDELRAQLARADPDRALMLAAELHQTAMMDPATYRTYAARFAGIEDDVAGRTPGERAFLAVRCTEACLRTLGAVRLRDWARPAVEHDLVDADDPHSGLWANVAFPLVFAEGFGLAAQLAETALTAARRHGAPAAIARAHLVLAMLHLRRGALRDAVADARTAHEIGMATPTFHTHPMAVGVLVEGLVELGTLDEADAVLAEAAGDGPLPELFLFTWTLYGRGLLRVAQGRLGEAIADLEEVGRRGREGWHPWNPAMFAYRSTLALARLAAGDPEGARAAAAEELELARRWDAARAVGIALRTHGVVAGRLEDLREAERLLRDSGAALEHARGLVELGAAVARTGRRVDAREPLAAGMEAAHRCGAAALTARAREELVAAGARPRRVVRSGVDALTPSELRVARLAADGMTNRQIAQALFVTLRTVQVHLTHTYQKLGIGSRDELPDALAR